MPIIEVIKVALATVVSLIGLVGLYIMFTAEVSTASQFDLYFKWALGAGIVFLAVGAAFAIFDREEVVATKFNSEKSER